tara:strand:+ start:991 stop:1167 length:177 start_codon:yes stop_codon:yes gene_type:complete
MECRNCKDGSIQTNGYCDVCGFNELQFVMEYDAWLDSLEAPAFIAEWEEWKESLEEVA